MAAVELKHPHYNITIDVGDYINDQVIQDVLKDFASSKSNDLPPRFVAGLIQNRLDEIWAEQSSNRARLLRELQPEKVPLQWTPPPRQ